MADLPSWEDQTRRITINSDWQKAKRETAKARPHYTVNATPEHVIE
jgi:hypothetical protein